MVLYILEDVSDLGQQKKMQMKQVWTNCDRETVRRERREHTAFK